MAKRLTRTLIGILAVAVSAAVMLTGCSKEQEAKPEVVRPVRLMTIGGDMAGGQREYPGRVEAAEEIMLSFEVPGRIIEMSAREGTEVAKGTLLARLDERDFQSAVDRETARRNEARADYERNQTLFERDAISLRDLEVVRRHFEVTEANLDQAEKALEDTRLTAPFTGRIAGRLVENHENITAKQPVIKFLDDSSLEIKADFPEGDFLRMRQGDPAEMTKMLSPQVEISAAPGTRIPAFIKELRSTADPVTRTFEVTLGFDAPEGLGVGSGMTARVIVQLPTGESGRQLVPAVAVVADDEGNPRVWVFDEETGAVTARPVAVGDLTGDLIEILGGLDNGERIAIQGASTLREGMRVRPQGD